MAKVHISIPVSESQREMLVQLAAENNMSLSAFCRDRIMAREHLADAFSTLQSTVIASIDAAIENQSMPNSHDNNHQIYAMVAEVLLLLRAMIPPQKMMSVHSELKRLGVTPFSE